MGRRWWFPIPVCPYASQIIQEFESSGFVERVAQFAKGHGHHDAFYVGRYS